MHKIDSVLDFGRGGCGIVHYSSVFGELTQDRGLVREIMQRSEVAALLRGGDLADYGQDPCISPVGAGEGPGGVQHAGSGYDATRCWFAGDLGRTHGHVGRTLFMASDDRPDFWRVDECIKEVVVLHPRDTKELVDIAALERLDHQMSNALFSHAPTLFRLWFGSYIVGG